MEVLDTDAVDNSHEAVEEVASSRIYADSANSINKKDVRHQSSSKIMGEGQSSSASVTTHEADRSDPDTVSKTGDSKNSFST